MIVAHSRSPSTIYLLVVHYDREACLSQLLLFRTQALVNQGNTAYLKALRLMQFVN